MFCSVELARRIERAEQRLVVSAVGAMRSRLPDALLMEVGGGIAAFPEPGSPLSKVVGLGFAAFEAAQWEVVEAAHARRAAPIQVELVTLADPGIARYLTARGYGLVGVENVLGRALAPQPDGGPFGAAPSAVASAITIEVIEPARLSEWIDVMTTGFATPDPQGVAAHESFDRGVVERILRDFASAEGVVLCLARYDGVPAGAASMRVDDGVAQLCGASTLPALRRRGVQSALLTFRLAHAAAVGCDVAVVTTQPGSKSMQNVQRQGFHLLYARNILRREA